MDKKAKIPWDYKREMAMPSVVINMPEFYAESKRRRRLRWLVGIGATTMVLLLCGLIVFEYFFGGGILSDPSVTVTVHVTPKRARGLEISIDGKPLSGHPPYIILPASSQYHSLRVQAPGYKRFSRDIKVNESQSIKVELEPIIEEILPDSLRNSPSGAVDL